MEDKEIILSIFRVEENKLNQIKEIDLKKKESKNVSTLLRAYSQSKEPSNFILKVLSLSSKCPYLAIEFLINIKKADEIIKCFWEEKAKGRLEFSLDYDKTYKSICRIFYLLNTKNLDNINLESLRVILESLREVHFSYVHYDRISEIRALIRETITILDEKKLQIVEKELGGEFILEDVKMIQEKIGSYKLNPTLSKSLIKIKESSPIDENEYARDIGYIRNFFQEIIEDIANKISIKYDEEIKKEEKGELKYTSCKRYLKKKEIINEREVQLINALWGLLSKDGSHKLTSPKEKYRLIFNMVIETSFLLLSNSEIFLSNN